MYIWRRRPQKEKHPHPPKTNTNRRFVLDFLTFYLSICLTISLLRLTWLPNYLPNYLTISTLYETSDQTYLPIGLTIGMHVRMYACTHVRTHELASERDDYRLKCKSKYLPIDILIVLHTYRQRITSAPKKCTQKQKPYLFIWNQLQVLVLQQVRYWFNDIQTRQLRSTH